MLAVVMAGVLLAAEKEKIAIVELDAPPGMLGLSTQVVKSIVNEAMRTRRSVLTPEDLREKLGNKVLGELSKCADKPACAADKLAVLGATKAVLGKLNRDEKNYVIQLYFIDLSKLTVISDIDRSILIASRRFQKDVDTAIPGFLRGEREALGTLTITATTGNAQVFINGEFMGVAPVTQSLKPGKYEVRVEKPKFLPIKRLVNVEANEKSVEDFRLLLKPGEREDELQPLAGQTSGAAEQGSGFALSPATLVAGGAAIATFGTAVAMGFVSKGKSDDLLKGYNSATDAYAGTRAQALDAQRDALIANVFYGISAAALVATVILVVLDVRAGGDSKTEVEVTPAPVPGGGALLLGGRF